MSRCAVLCPPPPSVLWQLFHYVPLQLDGWQRVTEHQTLHTQWEAYQKVRGVGGWALLRFRGSQPSTLGGYVHVRVAGVVTGWCRGSRDRYYFASLVGCFLTVSTHLLGKCHKRVRAGHRLATR